MGVEGDSVALGTYVMSCFLEKAGSGRVDRKVEWALGEGCSAGLSGAELDGCDPGSREGPRRRRRGGC